MREQQPSRETYRGQFRLTRLQTVNWGTFCGYKDFSIDPGGTLFTGRSGAGKSTLLDAHSIALLASADQHFNASADLTAKGAKEDSRNLTAYIRGAWSETADQNSHNSEVQYLRPEGPVWSAVAATYDDGDGRVTTAVVVKWFPTASAERPNSMFQLHEGHFHLKEMEEQWAQTKPEFDTAGFKRRYPDAIFPGTQKEYSELLGDRVGLGRSRSARALLGKAKAMKNVGNLDWFVRDNMLDKPETYDAYTAMVEAFGPLSDAFDVAKRAFDQRTVLADLPEAWAEYRRAADTHSLVEDIERGAATEFLAARRLVALETEAGRLEADQLGLNDAITEARQRDRNAEEEHVRALSAWKDKGSALQELESQREQAATRAAQSERDFHRYGEATAKLGRPCPYDRDTFTALADELETIADDAKTQLEPAAYERNQKITEHGQVQQQIRDKERELNGLLTARTLIPEREDRRRRAIAEATGTALSDLPYAAELIDLAEGQEPWRPAAERALRTFGLRLLVPEHARAAVAAFIDEHHMHGIVEYSITTTVPVPAPADPATLAGKLTVDTGHPAGNWVAAEAQRRFDHHCVEDASGLAAYERAITINGTIKHSQGHFRKDDRRQVVDPSSYILGANTAAKRRAVQTELDQLNEVESAAAESADTAETEYERLREILDAASALAEWETWDSLDYRAAQDEVANLTDRINKLKADSTDLEALKHAYETAREDARKANAALTLAKDRLKSSINQHDALQDDIARLEAVPHTITPAQETYLNGLVTDEDIPIRHDNSDEARRALTRALHNRRTEASSTRRGAEQRVQRAIDEFRERWQASAPDLSSDITECAADFVALFEDIDGRRLSEAVDDLRRLISNDMLPSINMLQRKIERASKQIIDNIGRVNTVLDRVRFDPEQDTCLNIAYRLQRSVPAEEFRKAVHRLFEHVGNQPAGAADLQQFQQVQALMKRFQDNSIEGRAWRESVLDVRKTYKFYGIEKDRDGRTVRTYTNTAVNSGGEQEKLVAFCLAAALSYNLADTTSGSRPRFAPLMLDEAFIKSDEQFATQALTAFDTFGFQLLMATPTRMSGVVGPFVGAILMVRRRREPDGYHSHAEPSSFEDLAAIAEAEED
jgi:uncharacterized protein YPO0396